MKKLKRQRIRSSKVKGGFSKARRKAPLRRPPQLYGPDSRFPEGTVYDEFYEEDEFDENDEADEIAANDEADEADETDESDEAGEDGEDDDDEYDAIIPPMSLNTPRRRTNRRQVSPAQADRMGGVFRNVYGAMAKGGVTVVSRGGSVAVKSGILRHSYSSMTALLRAASIASQGDATKITNASVVFAGAATSVRINAAKFFGLRIKWSDSIVNADKRLFNITVTPAGGVATEYSIVPKSSTVELFVLVPSNAAGLGIISTQTDVTVSIAADTVRAGSTLSVESLNARDI